MKKALFFIYVITALGIMSFTIKQLSLDERLVSPLAAPVRYDYDAQKSKIYWTGKGVGKQHTGTINIQSGTVFIDTKAITSGFVYIDMKSITNSDIKDAGFNKQLVDHLKSEDFFFSSKYPTSTFKITKAERLDVSAGLPNFTIEGDLIIRGIKKNIQFPATVTYGKNNVGIKADLTFDRTQFDVKYNSGNFMKDLGDKLIEDQITLKLDLLAHAK